VLDKLDDGVAEELEEVIETSPDEVLDETGTDELLED